MKHLIIITLLSLLIGCSKEVIEIENQLKDTTMALPSTYVGIAQIRNEIGESTDKDDIGSLILSSKVNRWGFNTVGAQQIKHWGVPASELAAPYDVGAFRNYDHSWGCYTVNDGTLTGGLAIYEAGELTISLIRLGGVDPNPLIGHYFDLYVSQNPFTTQNTGTKVWNNQPITTSRALSITPSDYAENSTMYVKLVHLSSPERRFDMNACEAQFNGNVVTTVDKVLKTIIFNVPIGDDPYTYVWGGSVTSGGWVVQGGGSIPDAISIPFTLYNGDRVAHSITINVDVCSTSNFSTQINSATATVSCPRANYVNGSLVLGSATGSAAGSVVSSGFTVGSTYYKRYNVNGGAWQSAGSGIVLASPPQ